MDNADRAQEQMERAMEVREANFRDSRLLFSDCIFCDESITTKVSGFSICIDCQRERENG